MGRTLQYFKWRHDWWLSLTPKCTTSNYPLDIHNGLCSYAHRQSHLYDNLTMSFVSHWRPYLSSQSLGSSWLGKYTSHVDPALTRLSQKTGAGLVPAAVSTPTLVNPSTEVQPLVDPPLHSESDDDSEGGEDVGTGGDFEDTVDAEDVLDDD